MKIVDYVIDIDSEQGKRKKILNAMKEKFGKNKVLNIATFTTEGSRSALLSAARGMLIDVDKVNYLTSLIPVERGFTWSLSDCFFGNEEKQRKPITALINEVNKYEGLMENALKIEGLIKARSVHASGIYIFNDDYTTQNAMMRASSGQPTTQFDMKDSDEMGALKVDALTVQALDRIRGALDLLIEYEYVESLQTLRDTYNAVLHPDVLEYKDKKMWDMVSDNAIPDLFQFDTQVGLQCAKKTKPQTVEELASANSLMRLMSENGNETPMDKFVRHKENPEEWYLEMNNYGLNDAEIKIVKKHLEKSYGVAGTQEEVMLLMMDEQISNFTVQEANFARKIIGKKLMDKIPEVQEMFFNKGTSIGASRNLLKYIWDTQVVPQLGYSFSSLHSTGYSLIALQEMNLATKYPEIIWSTSCLSVSANADEEEEELLDDEKKKNRGTKYGKVAQAIGKMNSHGIEVSLPDINKSRLSFSPDLESNKILYGLKGIVGINDDTVHNIIANRPYTSFDDFYNRIFKEGLIQQKQMIQLIKAGCFNSFDNPIEIMKQFIVKQVDVKEKLNMQNIKSIIRLGLLDNPELDIYKQYINFKDYISKQVVRTVDKPKDKILLLDNYSYNFYMDNFEGNSFVDGMEISEKLFKKEFDNAIQPLKDLMNTDEFVKKFNVAQFFEEWNKHAEGTIPKWEMESVSYYSNEHELDVANLSMYGVTDFFNLSEEPTIIGYNNYKGKETPKYQTYTIAGTVLDRDKNKHTITVLTKEGVVTCKTYSGSFAHYDKAISKMNNGKKETIEKSWFTRGNLLLLNGFRRGDQFVLRTYSEKGQPKKHTVNLIKEICKDGSLILQGERTQV